MSEDYDPYHPMVKKLDYLEYALDALGYQYQMLTDMDRVLVGQGVDLFIDIHFDDDMETSLQFSEIPDEYLQIVDYLGEELSRIESEEMPKWREHKDQVQSELAVLGMTKGFTVTDFRSAPGQTYRLELASEDSDFVHRLEYLRVPYGNSEQIQDFLDRQIRRQERLGEIVDEVFVNMPGFEMKDYGRLDISSDGQSVRISFGNKSWQRIKLKEALLDKLTPKETRAYICQELVECSWEKERQETRNWNFQVDSSKLLPLATSFLMAGGVAMYKFGHDKIGTSIFSCVLTLSGVMGLMIEMLERETFKKDKIALDASGGDVLSFKTFLRKSCEYRVEQDAKIVWNDNALEKAVGAIVDSLTPDLDSRLKMLDKDREKSLRSR